MLVHLTLLLSFLAPSLIKDKNSNCARWANSGFCTGRFKSFVKNNCPKSCKNCGGGSCCSSVQNNILRSPGYPSSYPNNVHCVYRVRIPINKGLLISFNDFSVESHSNCGYDYLRITDGSSNTIGTYCGNQAGNIARVVGTIAVLTFHTDATTQSRGFELSFSFFLQSPACRSVQNNALRSPGYPSNYPNNIDCVYHVFIPLNKGLLIYFNDFSLESHSRCGFDHLRITDGSNNIIIGTYCGNQTGKSVRVVGTVAELTFHTDRSVQSRGFELSFSFFPYSPACLALQNNALRSPGYPSNYPNNIDCVYHVFIPLNKWLLIYFHDFSLESHSRCGYDYLRITDGSHNIIIGTYCGNQTGKSVRVVSTVAELTFHTDRSVQSRGFELSFSFFPYSPACRSVQNNTLRSPGYPSNYPNNIVCVHRIFIPLNKGLLIYFNDFSLESHSRCGFDHLRIFDVSNNTIIGTYCGNQTGKSVRVVSTVAELTFHTDRSVQSRGFELSFSFFPYSPACLALQNNALRSPGYPSNYPNNIDCVYHVFIPLNKGLLIYFHDFSLESHFRCGYDYLRITDGSNNTIIGTYCGNQTGKSVRVVSTVAELTFHTDRSVQSRGFELSFSFFPYSPACLALQNNTLRSPGYPSNYPNNIDCVYHVFIPLNKWLLIYFHDFSLESHFRCGYDYLRITDGRTNIIIGTYCGNQTGKSVRVVSTVAELTFHTDRSVQSRGFELSFSFFPYSPACRSVQNNTLRSPGYPSNYPNNIVCVHRIFIPLNKGLLIYFNDFSLESHSRCGFDHLRIIDGSNNIIGTYCGNQTGKSVRVVGTVAELTFHTDRSVHSRGFELSFSFFPYSPGGGGCGYKPSSRIVGGTEAPRGAWPWQAQVRTSSGFTFCGGTLVDPQWVVTAAHCTVRQSASSLRVRLGAHYRWGNAAGTEQDFTVERIVDHESYRVPRGLAHDISLLKLSKPAQMTRAVGMACLPAYSNDLTEIDGKNCWVTGFGTLSSGGYLAQVLMQVSVPIVTQSTCKGAYGSSIHESMVCAGLAEGGKDSCQGDSGGPLVCEANGRFFLEGVVSWGSGCASPGKYGVYSRVRYLRKWVDTKIGSF